MMQFPVLGILLQGALNHGYSICSSAEKDQHLNIPRPVFGPLGNLDSLRQDRDASRDIKIPGGLTGERAKLKQLWRQPDTTLGSSVFG